MQTYERYEALKRDVLIPALEKFKIPSADHHYYLAYYLEGIAAIVREWPNEGCTDEVEKLADIMMQCVQPEGGRNGRQQQNREAPACVERSG